MALKRLVIIVLLLLICLGSGFSRPAHATELIDAAQLFEVHCVGCHVNGGNIIRRGKTLKLKALQRNGMDSVEAIAQIITNGKANMSAYGDRLTPEQIAELSTYVLERANQDWR